MVTTETLGLASGSPANPPIDVDAVVESPSADPVVRISEEAILRIEAEASRRGMNPDSLADLVAKELGGLELADCEPHHEPMVLKAITKWKPAAA
jgi:hypothetical protein